MTFSKSTVHKDPLHTQGEKIKLVKNLKWHFEEKYELNLRKLIEEPKKGFCQIIRLELAFGSIGFLITL